jgi:DNA-binding transcriptional LysR family regulator
MAHYDAGWWGHQIAAFSLAYPRITLTVDFSDTRRALIDDGFDLAIRMGPKSKNSATSPILFSVRRAVSANRVGARGLCCTNRAPRIHHMNPA